MERAERVAGATMAAVVAPEPGGPDVLELRRLEPPAPGAGQVRMRIHATSVNFADIKARRGGPAARFPFVPGLDAAGVIDAVGEGVDGVAPGQRVAAYTATGSYAELALADARLCFALPDALPFEQGAGIGVLVTARNVLERVGRLQRGERVLVHAAAGGVGSTLVQLARAMGAGWIAGTVGSDAKAAVAREAGADAVIDYRASPFDEVVMDLTDGRGVDLVLDAVAGRNAERGLACLAPFGRLVIYGHVAPEGAARFDSTQLHKSNRAVLGYSSGGYRRARPEELRAAGEAGVTALAAGDVRIVIGARYRLADAGAAQRLVEERRSVGKVLLTP